MGIDYLDRQLNAVATNPEFKLSDLNNDEVAEPRPVRESDGHAQLKQGLEEEDFNSLENRLKNIRKNLNFDQAIEQVN